MSDEVKAETARIREIVIRKLGYFIEIRKKNGALKRAKDNILFLIDNPDYVRITTNKGASKK